MHLVWSECSKLKKHDFVSIRLSSVTPLAQLALPSVDP